MINPPKLVLLFRFIVTFFSIDLVKTLQNGISWKLIWADEFNNALIDPTKWNHNIGNYGSLEYYTDRTNNSFIKNGCLVIQAVKESYKIFNFTSARVNSKEHFETQYGKFEMRAKLPCGNGSWPAFWLVGGHKGGTNSGEVDIMEFVAWNPHYVYGCIHSKGYDTSTTFFDARGFHSDFHTYSVIWMSEAIWFYVDGVLYVQKTRQDAQKVGGQWPFDATGYKMYIILNLAVGGWAHTPDASFHCPQQFIIDYVRVWKMSNATSTSKHLL